VHRDHQAAVEQRAAELAAEFDASGGECGSFCDHPPNAICSSGRCAVPP
jgi:hypothetical protein